MPTPFISPIERLVAEGKATPVSPETEARLLTHLRARYVGAAMTTARRNHIAREAVRDIPLKE